MERAGDFRGRQRALDRARDAKAIVWTSPLVQRAVPDRVAMGIALAIARGRNQLPYRRRFAAQCLAEITGDPCPSRALVEQRIVADVVGALLDVRRSQVARLPIDGEDVLADARRRGGPLVVLWAHMLTSPSPAIGSRLRRFAVVGGEWMWQPQPRPRAAIVRRAFESIERSGGRFIRASGGATDAIGAWLADGVPVILAPDMRGSRPSTLMGRPVRLATGWARAAAEHRAIVLLCYVVALGGRPRVVLRHLADGGVNAMDLVDMAAAEVDVIWRSAPGSVRAPTNIFV